MDHTGTAADTDYLSAYALPDYATGEVDRIYAMIALQMLVALSFLIMGATGLGRKLVDAVPTSIKAGIVLGAGVTAGVNVFSARMPKAPITVVIAVLMSYFFLFNRHCPAAQKNKWLNLLRNQACACTGIRNRTCTVPDPGNCGSSDSVGAYAVILWICIGAFYHIWTGIPGSEILYFRNPHGTDCLHYCIL